MINLCLGIITLFLMYGAMRTYLLYLKVYTKETSLPTIGTIHKNALKKSNKTLRLDKQEYISIPSSFLAFLAGLIDGDGYIQISKTPKGFITMKLVISLHLEDISTLEYIHSVLKLGKINIYKDLKSPTCKLVINKTDLQEVLFPLFIYNNIFFLTNTRIDQFNLAMYILRNDIKLQSEISEVKNVPFVFEIPKSPVDYTLLPFFKNWIVGFKHPWRYPDLIEFVRENPLTYKRVKKEYKRLCSNRKSYYNLLKYCRDLEHVNKK
uniref:LAGLIDADG endonuclease n=3 Tax=Fusarium sambucinum species complex TaxID=569360 RepID=A0A6G6B3B8_FUSCU|nr:LAGLIDADG endonuclease [Fusarium acaciae-mearnsii]YP_010390605.1 LAGLIDADG endonuclease [Fusarium aethiopicum]YP_010390658.1 LAGLIDADG endonuclease [Fusarium asiaticum]YP_010390715.1 LAGLIDADG endonuclease [Fusarium austroamericanum]YP_010390772.1 LAGLIDADG endonuclease [Fusarium boothii]YP_010391029.1 LAGLIDADG endonuclease [Fusarium mesoamericanum]YP_010391082.1 LAGLIDADG endonuclease [Fusarium nepalense]YP_010391197.1 LAGLIDADG endonuclease [Fusarium vorosii]AYN73120.1 LAGLIDADG endon